jgi:hypothetical protein
MPVYREQAHAEGVPGDYGVHPTFAHGGTYRMRLNITPPGGGPAFDSEFPLQVADAVEGRRRRLAIPPRFTMECSSSPRRPKAGEPVDLRFVIRDRDNPKAAVRAIETVHEALLHLIVVRADLSHFAHEHPEQQPDGSFVLKYIFPSGGDFRLFADVAPKGAGSQILSARVQVSGPKTPAVSAQPPTDLKITIPDVQEYPSRQSVRIQVRLSDPATSQPVRDLEPYLGVLGHFLFVHEDGATFVHSHPVSEEPGRIEFLVRFPKPGQYRGWMQGKRAGQVFTATFTFRTSTGPAE